MSENARFSYVIEDRINGVRLCIVRPIAFVCSGADGTPEAL